MLLRQVDHEPIEITNFDRPSQNPQTPQRDVRESSAQFGVDKGDNRETPPASGLFVGTPVSNESSESREDRLRRIRQDVDNGKYDSDELLEQALETLLKRLSNGSE